MIEVRTTLENPIDNEVRQVIAKRALKWLVVGETPKWLIAAVILILTLPLTLTLLLT